jgi:hypothetical protein
MTGYSANTQVIVCVSDCTPTGVKKVIPPHPIWSNNYGELVTQLNMITLGGPNGLNS